MTGRLSLCVLAVLLIGLGGCDGDQPSPDMKASAVRAQMAWDSAQQEYVAVQDIENRLVRRCLTQKGFQIFPADPPSSNTADKGAPQVSPSPADAARVGYGLDPRRQPEPGTASDGTAYAQTSNDYKAKLTIAEYGPDQDTISYVTPDGGTKVEIPRTGCLGDVRTSLYGDLKAYLRLSFTADNLVGSNDAKDAENDSGFESAASKWRDCVSKAGYPGIQSTKDMRDRARRLYDGIAPTDTQALDAALASEIKIATADATCAASTGLNEAYAAAQAKAATKSLAAHEADLVAWDDLVRKALKKGQELLNA